MYIFFEHNNIDLVNCWRVPQVLISGKAKAGTPCISPIFSLLHIVIRVEQHVKYLYHQNSHYGKYGRFARQGVRPSGYCRCHYVSFLAILNLLHTGKGLRSAFASSVVTKITLLRTEAISEAITRVPHNRHLHGCGGRTGHKEEQRKTTLAP